MSRPTAIVTDWHPVRDAQPSPEQLRDIFHKELLDFGPALYLADRDGVVRWCNVAFRRIVELPVDGGQLMEMMRFRDIAEEIDQNRSTVYREQRVKTGGAVHFLRSRHVPLFDTIGELTGFGGLLNLFAENTVGMDDSSVIADRYADFLRLTADWVWETDAQLNFVMVSQRVMNAIGRAPQELIGTNLLALSSNPELANDVKRRFDRLSPFREQAFDMHDSEGRGKTFLLSAVPVFDRRDGALQGFRGAATDVTELNRRENGLRAAKEAADVANMAKTQFLANMSHELRTPLNAIIGFSDVMRMEMIGPVGNPQYRAYISDIHGSALHLLGIINDVLDVSRIEAGKVQLMESVVNLEEVFDSVLRLVRERQTEAGLTMDIALPSRPPRLNADKRKLKQILINLIGNAIKFTPEGGNIKLSARLLDQGGLEIVVSDNGIGIASEDIERVLQPFVQADSALHRKFDGAGLGLPLSRGLARLHGGDLVLDSTPGRGTRAIVILPPERVMDGPQLTQVK
ncbi:ATP-binding protein [Dongia soli]|uniref:histidine kinase n=1 Tax=Dongia soli TaxID=600628 RepID=A0ABU5E7J4_9PROT|nr:ATP-binding protein [Dongia soli]MDY0882255.1 ATP-binding protein [Dongia soli]